MTLVIAHRGASWELPENTLPAFERAIEVGADYVELDVHATAAGELVVTHEPPASALARADALPSLEEVLELCRGRIGVMVELKTPYRYRRHDVVPRTLALLDDEAVLVSFEAGAIALARALRPRLRTLQHVASVPMRVAAARGCWAVGLEDPRATPRVLAAARRLGVATTVYTVNDTARMRSLAELGVTGIFTDRPEVARRVLGPRSASRRLIDEGDHSSC
ncbi:MAG: glycerophosphodiester phosphodiesterase [Actinomycetota bacterium]|nr:glycerophosphodiester phosphodiesterase [Actinomycetota bacterium]